MTWGLKDNAIEIVDGCNALNIKNGHAQPGHCNWHRDLRALLSPEDTLADMCAMEDRTVPRTFENVFVFPYLADQFDRAALRAIAETCLRLPRSAAAVTLLEDRLDKETARRARKAADERALRMLRTGNPV